MVCRSPLQPETIQLVLLLSLEPTLHADSFQSVVQAWGRSDPSTMVQQQQFASLSLLQALLLNPLPAVEEFLPVRWIRHNRRRSGWTLYVSQRGLAGPIELLQLP